jgi:hypothetical protein
LAGALREQPPARPFLHSKGTTVANATSTSAPSEGLRETITDLTDHGFELEEKLAAFLADVRKAGQKFDAEVCDLDDGDERYQNAALESGLGTLHAIEEHLLDVLAAELWWHLPDTWREPEEAEAA